MKRMYGEKIEELGVVGRNIANSTLMRGVRMEGQGCKRERETMATKDGQCCRCGSLAVLIVLIAAFFVTIAVLIIALTETADGQPDPAIPKFLPRSHPLRLK